MKIGIDVSPLQGPHRMRGIGYTTSNFLRAIPKNTKHSFVLYAHRRDDDSIAFIQSLLPFSEDHYEIRYFVPTINEQPVAGQLKFIVKIGKRLSYLLSYRFGSKQYGNTRDLGAFIQTDQGQPLPIMRGKKLLIAYDLIPYVLEKDYLWSYRTSRQNGRTRRSALKSTFNRGLYLRKAAYNARFADTVLAISQATKNDFIRYAHVPKRKIKIVHLGVDRVVSSSDTAPKMQRFIGTSWGYIQKPASLKGKDFLLFVGGADNRRKLADLVAAFNQLKARGSNLCLVLSGDTMRGPKAIPSLDVQHALLSSPFLDDIYFMGFTDDLTKNWLYKNAKAFVFPSTYEGFGLPILEAMEFETPVICYDNLAVREVGGDTPLFATDVLTLVQAIERLLGMSVKERQKLIADGRKRSESFSWETTAKELLTYAER